MRLVLDTNVLVQALRTAHGPANTIVGLALVQSFTCIVDERMMEEYEDVLGRSRFDFHRSDVAHLLRKLRQVADIVAAAPLPGGTKGFPDPDDVMFLEVAVSSRAEALITTNLRHFPEPRRHGITVVTPIEFVQRHVRVG